MAIKDISELRHGQKVHYKPAHFGEAQWENGIIKRIREGTTNGAWVVYKCGGDWDNYADYTGALTNLEDLNLGWRFDNGQT